MILCRLLMFFSSNQLFQKHSFENMITDQNVKWLGYSLRSGPTFLGPDLGPNCLQSLSADNKSRRKQARN